MYTFYVYCTNVYYTNVSKWMKVIFTLIPLEGIYVDFQIRQMCV